MIVYATLLDKYIDQLSFCPSISPNPKGRLRERTHLKRKGIVVMITPAHWCSIVFTASVCLYMVPASKYFELYSPLHDIRYNGCDH